MRYFYDTEFIEDGHTIDLVSIGIVAENGREFYAVSAEFHQAKLLANPWLVENVWPYLPTTRQGKATGGYRDVLDLAHPDVKPRAQIAKEVHAFLLRDGLGSMGQERELWAWYAAYDHVALCQLWGRMIDLPAGVPMFTRDIKQEAARLGNPDMPDQAALEHHALADARHDLVMFRHLQQIEQGSGVPS